MNKSTYIANQIRDKILNTKELAPNQALKTEVELCKEYNVSKMTLKKAIDILGYEGLVYKHRGVGTFVKNVTESPFNNIRDRYKDCLLYTSISFFSSQGVLLLLTRLGE